MHTNGKIFDINIFRGLADFIRSIYFDDISFKEATDKQGEMKYLVRSLKVYKLRNCDKIKARAEVLKNAKIIFQARNLIVTAFEENIFSLPKEKIPQHEVWTEEEKGKLYTPSKERSEFIAEEEGINDDSFRDYFKYQNPSHMYKNLNSKKNTERNQIQADLIKSALTDLKNKIKNINKESIKNGVYCWKDSWI